jgi:amidophosphoribosyltransferase
LTDELRDHCGVVGIFGHAEASKLTYLALYALQHRGQDSAGIVSKCGDIWSRHAGVGLVADVFNETTLESLKGDSAIGHVRYTTAGTAGLKDAQPLLVKTGHGYFSVAHNGNLVNAAALRDEMEKAGNIFQTDADTELFCHLYAQSRETDVVKRLKQALTRVSGAYSLCILTEDGLIGIRDPYGVRPLALGRLDNGYVLASEDCAFDLIDAKRVREIEPGEIVVINGNGIRSEHFSVPGESRRAQCIFEHVYFARPDSHPFGISAYASRMALGEELAKEAPVKADVVIAVPDSGVIAAMGYARALGLPFESGLVRNHYVGRTFIEPESRIRHFGVRLKLSPVRSVVENRRLVVIDDSIVRGTTSRKIVKMIRQAGAREIHLRVAAPRTLYPCYYGIDTPERSELIAATHSLEEIRRFLEVDSVEYLSIDGMHRAVENAAREKTSGRIRKQMCDACFSGDYPIK